MENGAETIQENFSAAVSKTDDETISGVKDFRDGLKMKGVTLIDIFYPVGCIYQSVKNTEPSVMFGGTWGRIKGKVLVGVDESDPDFNLANKTGGAKTHTLKVEELAPHSHNIGVARGDNPAAPSGGTNGFLWHERPGKDSVSSGGGKPHNNIQPYSTVYMWVRTA